MEKYKILKVYFLVFLVLIYGIYAFLDEFIIFFTATLMFNMAISLMFMIAILVLFATVFKVLMLEINLDTIKNNIDNLKAKHFDLLYNILPKNIIDIYLSKVNKDKVGFTVDEKDQILDHVDGYFSSNKSYIDFFVGTSLMLGLLGTFMGLLIAIDEMSKIIDMLVAMKEMKIKVVIAAFGGPLGGMSVGFGSSLFGVTVAILLNLLYYILSKAQARYLDKKTIFFNTYLEIENVEDRLQEQIQIENNQEELLRSIHSLIQMMAKNKK